MLPKRRKVSSSWAAVDGRTPPSSPEGKSAKAPPRTHCALSRLCAPRPLGCHQVDAILRHARLTLDQIAATDECYHAFLHVAAEQALATAAGLDASIAAGEKPPSPLAGVPPHMHRCGRR